MHTVKRACGILLPVASLPSRYGIGTFSKEAYAFVDFLAAAGQRYWQILPLGPTGYGDSPYQSFSTYAGNPYYIDLERLIAKKLLTRAELSRCNFGQDPAKVDYERLGKAKFTLLRKAYERAFKEGSVFLQKEGKAFRRFCKEEAHWLDDYSLYMTCKNLNRGKSWDLWEEDLKLRKKKALTNVRKQNAKVFDYYRFLQYLFFTQWRALKSYANEKGIRIIGDLPIYVAYDSADTWAHPELFQLEWSGRPDAVSGCPPDAYAVTGQLWGNPLYRWRYHEETGFAWWIERLKHTLTMYDVVRIDHFRGFEAYYSIPYGDETAEFGHWEKGPGYALFQALKEALPEVAGKELKLIAEDLGFLTPAVRKLQKRCGFPGMKVLQFAFDEREDSDYLPYRYEKNTVVYTGTHDNNTTRGWFKEISKNDLAFVYRYLDIPKSTRRGNPENVKALVRLALSTTADTAIIPLQDYLQVDETGRINTPSTLGGNWMWRVGAGVCTDALAKEIRALCALYGRTTYAEEPERKKQ